jgi:hypothetical protein
MLRRSQRLRKSRDGAAAHARPGRARRQQLRATSKLNRVGSETCCCADDKRSALAKLDVLGRRYSRKNGGWTLQDAVGGSCPKASNRDAWFVYDWNERDDTRSEQT